MSPATCTEELIENLIKYSANTQVKCLTNEQAIEQLQKQFHCMFKSLESLMERIHQLEQSCECKK